MKREELLTQYDRFIDQIRTEVKDLYWLYNFFFIIESAVLGAVFAGKISPDFNNIVQISGLFLSLYWFVIIRKQRLWRHNWVYRIKIIETELGYNELFQMWKFKTNPHMWKDYIVGRHGMWNFLFALPIFFALVWIILIIFY